MSKKSGIHAEAFNSRFIIRFSRKVAIRKSLLPKRLLKEVENYWRIEWLWVSMSEAFNSRFIIRFSRKVAIRKSLLPKRLLKEVKNYWRIEWLWVSM